MELAEGTHFRVSIYYTSDAEAALKLTREAAKLVRSRLAPGASPVGKIYVTMSEIELPPTYELFIKGLLEDSNVLLTADPVRSDPASD